MANKNTKYILKYSFVTFFSNSAFFEAAQNAT